VKREAQAALNKAMDLAGGKRVYAKAGGKRAIVFGGLALRAVTGRERGGRLRPEIGPQATPQEVLEGLDALRRVGVLKSRRGLDVAYLRLTGEVEVRLCHKCGVVTRHSDGWHMTCRPR
jgi:hypothetical protein